MDNDDRKFMRRAITLAKRGRGATSPNPLVGAVVVNNGIIVGEGYHRSPGTDHAEIVALKAAGKKTEGSTLYVNLEPCDHHGRTPPCTGTIVEMGVRRVVTSVTDPNPLVNGKGFEKLRGAGITVETGILAHEAERLNEAYLTFMRTGRPFVTLKLAQTLDGRIADTVGHSRWISSERSRRYVHRLRSEADAIMVGIGTIKKDDPSLDVRHVRGRNPMKIIVDNHLRIPLTSRVFDGARVIVAAGAEISQKKRQDIETRGAEVWVLPGGKESVNLVALMERLASGSIMSVLVEGGSRLAASLLREKLINKVMVFIAPGFMGEGLSAIEGVIVERRKNELTTLGLSKVRVQRVGEDILYSGYPRYE